MSDWGAGGWGVWVLVAAACGAIPFGMLIARSRGIDLRAHGSGNIGATNVWRVMGRRAGLTCFVLDVLKGLVPVLGAGLAMGTVRAGWTPAALPAATQWWWLAVMAGAIVGHMFTPLAGFRGGKGVATGLGAALGLWPVLTVPAAGALVLWIAVAWRTRMVSVASCVSAAALPGMVWAWGAVGEGGGGAWWPVVATTGLLGALVIVRHRANLQRVWNGTENRIGTSRPTAASGGGATGAGDGPGPMGGAR